MKINLFNGLKNIHFIQCLLHFAQKKIKILRILSTK